MLYMQDASFLYMGRLLDGFGVGIISYVVCSMFCLIILQDYENQYSKLHLITISRFLCTLLK